MSEETPTLVDQVKNSIGSAVEFLRIDFNAAFLFTVLLYVIIDLFNLGIMLTGNTGAGVGYLHIVNFLIFMWILIQDRHQLKTKASNNRLLLVGFLSYITFILTMFAMGNEVFVIEVILFTGIYGLWAISLNMSTGIVGILNFGVIAQVAVGAVFVGIATVNGWPILLAVIVGMLVAGLFSAFLAFTTVRLRDDYFAIISITIGEIIRQFLNSEPSLRASPSLSEGQQYPATPGILSIPQPFSEVYINAIQGTFLEPYGYRLFLGVFGIILLLATYFLANMIFNSPYGRVLRAIREDDTVVESYGRDVLFFKVAIMFVSGMVAGLGGALYGWTQVSLFPNNFLPLFTFYIWVAFVMGGRGNNKGMIFGAMIFVILERSSRFLNDPSNPIIRTSNRVVQFVNPSAPAISLGFIQLTIVGVFLILFLRFLPRGILPEEPYEPDIDGYRLPERGSQSSDQKSITGGSE